MTISWAGRLATIGATSAEIASIQAAHDASPAANQSALDLLIEGASNGELLSMLTNWRSGNGPFASGFPGGGLPFGTNAAILSGNPGDDTFAISAGTGIKLSPGSGGVQIAGDLGGTTSSPVVETVQSGKSPAVLDGAGNPAGATPALVADASIPDGSTDNTTYLANRLAVAMTFGLPFRIPASTHPWVISNLTLLSGAQVDATGATFQQATGTNTNLITNKSCTLGTPGSVRDSNISWIGGTFTKGTGQTNNGTNTDLLIIFGFVDGLSLKNVSVSQSGTGGLAGTGGTIGCMLWYVTAFTVDNFTGQSASGAVNQCTFQLDGACAGGHIKGIYGSYGDDAVAISPDAGPYGFPAQGLGEIHNVTVEDVFCTAQSNGVRIQPSSTAGSAPFYGTRQITVRNVDGHFGARGGGSVAAVYVGGNSGYTNSTGNVPVTDVIIENVNQRLANTPAVLFPSPGLCVGVTCRACVNLMDSYAIIISSSLGTFKICDADYTTAITTGAYYPIHVTTSVRKLILDNVRVNAATTGTATVAPILLDAGNTATIYYYTTSVTGIAWVLGNFLGTASIHVNGVVGEATGSPGYFTVGTAGAVTVYTFDAASGGTATFTVNGSGTVATKDSRLPGANGTAVLVAGTKAVTPSPTSLATASSKFRLTNILTGGTLGILSVAPAAGSFTVNSSNASDTSSVYWEIVSS